MPSEQNIRTMKIGLGCQINGLQVTPQLPRFAGPLAQFAEPREHRNYKVDIVILAHAELLSQSLSNRFLSGVRLLFRLRELV